MNPARREAIRNAIEIAKKRHATRSHLQREYVWATVEQLQYECRSYWPAGTIFVAVGIGAALTILLLSVGVTR